MDRQSVLEKTEVFIHQKLDGEGSGHDWWHVHRVRMLALAIGRDEGADLYIVELGALLHDVADWKFHDDEHAGENVTREWLTSLSADKPVVDHVCGIVRDISYKGAGVATPMQTLEGRCVQDADRLDAIGAVGIARAFAYGGHKNRPLYDPNNKPQHHESFEAYKNNQGTTVNHFYEKLLLLKDRMNTDTARRMAERRHRVMEDYLKEFFDEWEGAK